MEIYKKKASSKHFSNRERVIRRAWVFWEVIDMPLFPGVMLNSLRNIYATLEPVDRLVEVSRCI
jgi:hypothetical protein